MRVIWHTNGVSLALTPAPPTGEAAEAAPDLESFAALVAPGTAKLKSVRDLHAWLCALIPTGGELDERVEQICAGGRWLRAGGAAPVEQAGAVGNEPLATRKLRVLVRALETVPAFRVAFVRVFGGVLDVSSALALLETGLPNQRGLGAETSDRLARRFLPRPRDPHDLSELLAELFPSKRDAAWLGELPTELGARFAHLLDGKWGQVAAALEDAVALAAGRSSSLGLTPEIRARSPEVPLRESPFFQLTRLCDEVCALVRAGVDLETAQPAREACDRCIEACRQAVTAVLSHLEEFGVSVDVVYRIEVISKNLDRLGSLLQLLAPGPSVDRYRTAIDLLAGLERARIRDRSLRDLVSTNPPLLARKIIERAGQTGEHYITATRKEYGLMIASASGGGLLTVGTTWLKYLVVWGHLPLFVEGFFSSLNYADSFLLMQLLGFTLATKQPSMTAAALAGSLKGRGEKLDETVTMIARICRSQLAAAVGNLGMAIPASFAFDLLYRHFTGHPFFDEHAAEHTLQSFHPLHSGTIFFAALTGVLLWLSSVGAGWVENWATYRRIPTAIAQHRWSRWVGAGTMRWLGRKLTHGLSGIGGNVSLGFLLGMVPVLGKFLGLPLEVRHVTLSTCGLSLAVSSLGPNAFHHAGLWPAAAGILIMGALNFGVSFALALGVAMRAREVERGGFRLFGAVLRRVVRSPGQFFFPPKAA